MLETLNNHAAFVDAADTVLPVPLPDAEVDLLRSMSAEAAGMSPLEPRVGRHYPAIRSVLARYSQRAKAIHPDLTPNCFAESIYKDESTKMQIKMLERVDRHKLAMLYYDYSAKISDLAVKVAGTQMQQQIVPGLLDVPVYEKQTSAFQCFNACFRMIANTVSDNEFDEGQVKQVMDESGYEDGIADDERYLNMLSSTAFGWHSAESVQVKSFIGIDLATIGKITGAIKAQREGRRVFGVLSLASETTGNYDGSIWHNGMLLSADEATVTYHDPAPRSRGCANRITQKQHFLKRWAETFNRCHLVTVTPRDNC